MPVAFIRRRDSNERVREPPKFTKTTGCFLVSGIVFAIVVIIISACSDTGFSSINLHSLSGSFRIIFLVLCLVCFLAFISKILALCAANVNLVDPPTGTNKKQSRSRSSSEMSLANRNQNNASRRGSTVSISTPYEHFSSNVRRPSTSSTALASPTPTRARNSPDVNETSQPVESTDPFKTFAGLSVDSLPPSYDSVNIAPVDKLSITDMPSPKHIKSNLCSNCGVEQQPQNSSNESFLPPIEPPAYESLNQEATLDKSQSKTDHQDSVHNGLNVCPKCGAINVLESKKN